MPYGLRAKCCTLADNLGPIEAWRETLAETERASQNNPEVVLRSWRRSTAAPLRPQKAAPRHIVIGQNGGKGKGHRPICWPQDAIRRAADALREARSTDYLVQAKVALENAVRSHADLEALFEPPARRHSQPAEKGGQLGKDTAAAFAAL
jgi:hypothetical protein